MQLLLRYDYMNVTLRPVSVQIRELRELPAAPGVPGTPGDPSKKQFCH